MTHTRPVFLSYSGYVHRALSLCLINNESFQSVSLPSLEAILNFLSAVPSQRYGLIRHLQLSTKSISYNPDQCDAFTRPVAPEATSFVVQLLAGCVALEHLSLAVCGTLAFEAIMPVFRALERMRSLKLENVDEEETNPL